MNSGRVFEGIPRADGGYDVSTDYPVARDGPVNKCSMAQWIAYRGIEDARRQVETQVAQGDPDGPYLLAELSFYERHLLNERAGLVQMVVETKILSPIIKDIMECTKNSDSTKPWVRMQQLATKRSGRITNQRHGRRTPTKAAMRSRSHR